MAFQLFGTAHLTNPERPAVEYLNPAQIQDCLAAWRYKPGWTFTLYTHQWEGLCIDIALTVPNGYNWDEPVDLNIRVPVPPIVNGQHFVDWLMWRVARIELHELREFSIYHGEHVSDPHNEEVTVA